jgi:potassium/hydrogen antiporter
LIKCWRLFKENIPLIKGFFLYITKISKWFLSWVGLRGAVPVVFAIYPLLAGAEQANMIFDIVFFVSLTSVIIQGTILPKVAGWLKLTFPEKFKKEQ